MHAYFACCPRVLLNDRAQTRPKIKWKSSIFHDVFKVIQTSRPLMTSAAWSLETFLDHDSFDRTFNSIRREDTVSTRLGIIQLGIMSASKAFMGNHSFGS